jgi:hypothetical protein
MSSELRSKDIQASRHQGSFALSTSGTDRSRFAVTPQELFEYRPPAYDPI